MRELSEQTRRLLERLPPRPRPSWLLQSWQYVWRSPFYSRHANVFKAIETSGEAAAILYIRDWLISKDRQTRAHAAATVQSLAQRLVSRDYVWLDQTMRVTYLNAYAWLNELTPKLLRTLARTTENSSVLVKMASMHGSGHVREQSIKLMRELATDGNVLPYMLIRCADWVEQVRSEAAAAVGERLLPRFALDFVLHLPLVKRLQECERSLPENLLRDISTFLTSAACSNALREGFTYRDAVVRRESFACMLASSRERLIDIINLGMSANDDVVRRRAAEAAINGLACDELRTQLTYFAEDRSMPVRRIALHSLASRFPDIATSFLERSLLDRHASVRESARYWIRQREPERDFRNHYATRINTATGHALTAVIAGIGECGNASDIRLLDPFLTVGLPRNRRAALKACYRLDPASVMPKLLVALVDVCPANSRLATCLIRRQSFGLHADELIALAESIQLSHAHRNLLTILARINSWRSLSAILAACRHHDPEVSSQAGQSLRVFATRPSIPVGSASEMAEAYGQFLMTDKGKVQPIAGQLEFMFKRD